MNSRTISVHKKPASDDPNNRLFDGALSNLRVRSEHCIGALKGRFQCLRGLRAKIHNPHEHALACRWITITIILHNLVIDVEGGSKANLFGLSHSEADEHTDTGDQTEDADEQDSGVAKRRQLVAEIVAFKAAR